MVDDPRSNAEAMPSGAGGSWRHSRHDGGDVENLLGLERPGKREPEQLGGGHVAEALPRPHADGVGAAPSE